jgi:bifunctional non-homologous end joining protein LigD
MMVSWPALAQALSHSCRSPPAYGGMLWRVSQGRSRRTPPAGFIVPCQPLLVDKPPAGLGWLHEVKHDGYRILARKEGSRVILWTHHGTNFTDRLPKIAEAICSLAVDAL